jgi:hypothetical protein
MLFRNLIYIGLTRAKNLTAFVGTRKALAMAVKNQDASQRETFLQKLLALSLLSFKGSMHSFLLLPTWLTSFDTG